MASRGARQARRAEAVSLAQCLGHLGVGMEPDVRFGGLWVPETARTACDLLVRPRKVARHDPLTVPSVPGSRAVRENSEAAAPLTAPPGVYPSPNNPGFDWRRPARWPRRSSG